MGVVSTVIFTFSSGLLLYIPALSRWKHDKLCGTAGGASRYTASLDQRSKVETQYGYTLTLMVLQTPLGSLFCQGEPSFQPPVPRTEDTRWQPKSNSQSIADKGKEDERPRPQYVLKGRANDEDEEVNIQLGRRRNLARN
ncbi:hypothetical protein PVK06_026569 [Gossypium arboreum]|uniref:Uncharacterized protein n=1 Tax=Gossypium arboreum TaxID=29729 RepID=A0ABR0NY20_GOSAR|nr:hypothetical protein PVK06_026569 [Gossypium arboreum]